MGLERHFARRHVPQRVEYVCPFGGYGCTKGVSQAAARNPDMKMARRHARRWHSEEAELNEVIRSVPYVVVDNRDYVAPGDIPSYPSNPQGPGSRPFRDWPFLDDRAGPRWTVESVRDGYVSKEGMGRPKPHSEFQAREKKCTVGTVMTNIGKTLKAPQAFSGGSSSISGVSVTPGDRPSDMNPEEAKEVNIRIAPRARVEFPRSDYGDMPKTI